MSLNLFSANGSLGNGDAGAFLKSVVVFVSREIEKSSGEFVIGRDDAIKPNIGLKFFNLEGINNGFRNFFHDVTS